MRRTTLIAAALLLVAMRSLAAQDARPRGCIGSPFWHTAGAYHYPGILADLTQRNGSRSATELDELALELARSAADPDEAWVAEQIETHWGPVFRADAERAAARNPCYDEDDVDGMVARALAHALEDLGEQARGMASNTLRLAAHRGSWLEELDPDRPGELLLPSERHAGNAGIAYDGDGAFEAARILFVEAGGEAGSLMEELDAERAVEVFQGAALRSGRTACAALHHLRRLWDEDEERTFEHPSYRRLRRESPERCPELDDPDPGG